MFLRGIFDPTFWGYGGETRELYRKLMKTGEGFENALYLVN